MNVTKKRIQDLVADEYPISVIARKAGIHRQYVYAFLDPAKHPYTLTDETLQRIADFEGRAVDVVRREFEMRKNSERCA